MAGRPRKPIEILEFEGKTHLTKEEIEERKKTKIVAPADKVEPPKYLPKKLKDKFSEIANELLEIGIMTNLDNEALARYLVSEENYQKVSKTLLKPKAIDNLDQFDKLSKIQERLFKQTRAAATDLGLSISSRGKLVLPKPKEKPKEKTAEEALFGATIGKRA
ncbi:phage terminase small subunit P27 family [Vagococcus sp. BWB3-3]|uniref:Phage terminase small subunit P27 family n=1 Tax=Vagococcus allomyrinae TaxID=2794353 RepID=A0A940SVJ1_9ENTE|nr:phage terminase small subunit P27 family [Vagococcus allomyrinae]MBP1040378.1 phage terminase small subunit P27 family [Vagococcus allomyrinae]